MAVTLKEVRNMLKELKPQYQEKHSDLAQLRDFWHGRYWKIARATPNSISTIFRDLVSRPQIVGPEVMLVHNVLQEVCVKFQSYFSGLPQISMYTDGPGSQTRRAQADRKERFLYGTWAEGNMIKKSANAGWYLPLFGQSYLAAFPDFEKKLVTPIVRSPEHAYPVMGYDGQMDALIFNWKIPENVAKKTWPKYRGGNSGDTGAEDYIGRDDSYGGRNQPVNSSVDVIEYSDDNEWVRWVGDTKVNGVEHGWGWNIFEEIKFINVPGEPWGHGAVEQIANLVAAGNALDSLLFQAVYENTFPMLVLEDPSKAPEEIETGPGAVLPLNPGGKAYYITPPLGALGTQAAFSGEIERKVKQGASMPDVNFGNARNSIITGKAINELQGAGTGSLVEMVQGTEIGPAYSSWNSKAIEIQRNLWPDESVALFGQRPGSMSAIKPERFQLNIKGSQLVGSTRNDVIFSPHLNDHEKVVMNLQMAGAGLVSKRYQRDQVGIPDSEAMDEEMIGEAIQDAVVQTLIMGLQQGATPEAAMDAEAQATAYMAGGTHLQPAIPLGGAPPAPGLPVGAPGPMGAPPGAPASPGGGLPIGPLGPGAPGQVMAPALQLPPGSPVPPPEGQPIGSPTGAPPEAGALSDSTVTLSDITSAIAGLSGITGQVWLVGAIVAYGSTDGDIEVDLTDASDQQIIEDGLPQWAGRFTFHVVPGEPKEDNVEVTPGNQGALPGGPPAAPELAGAPL